MLIYCEVKLQGCDDSDEDRDDNMDVKGSYKVVMIVMRIVMIIWM